MKLLIAFLFSLPVFAGSIVISWNPNDPAEAVTNYRIYWSTNVSGPFTVLTNTGTNVSYIANLTPAKYFFYVTAQNMWDESLPSDTVNTPPVASKVAKPVISK